MICFIPRWCSSIGLKRRYKEPFACPECGKKLKRSIANWEDIFENTLVCLAVSSVTNGVHDWFSLTKNVSHSKYATDQETVELQFCLNLAVYYYTFITRFTWNVSVASTFGMQSPQQTIQLFSVIYKNIEFHISWTNFSSFSVPHFVAHV